MSSLSFLFVTFIQEMRSLGLMRLSIILLNVTFATFHLQCGEQSVDVSVFLPKHTTKFVHTNFDINVYDIFDLDTKEHIATREETEGKTVSLTMFKNGKLNGLKREWFPNGQKLRETPYLNGILDGIQRNWDENGNLVGRNVFRDGNGLVRVYHSNGILALKGEYKKNVRQGIWDITTNDGQLDIANYVNDKMFSVAYTFHENGAVEYVIYHDENGRACGPCIVFSKTGSVVEVLYRLNHVDFSKEEYLELCKTQPGLPKLKENLNDYKTIPAEIKRELEAFKAIKPVKIPLLDLDEK